jgi:hypothetical protein
MTHRSSRAAMSLGPLRLGGSRMMGPDEVMEGVDIGLFNDPEDHVIGLTKSAS